MSELDDFKHFKEVQLHFVDFDKGYLDTIRDVVHFKTKKVYRQTRKNVGSLNLDGYVRVWCNGSLRMQHRLLYWLYHGVLPENLEVDHIDKNRSNNSIQNLRLLDRASNNLNNRTLKKRFIFKDKDVHQVCKLLSETSESDLSISIIVGCSRVAVREIKIRKNHTHISKMYKWVHRNY